MNKKKYYGNVLRWIEIHFGIENAKKFEAKTRFGRKIDLKNPHTLADKICWLSLHGNLDDMARCTDKWTVRDYVREKGLGHILIPAYGTAIAQVDKLSFLEYPEQFMLKATHGCRMNYPCRNKKSFDQATCKIAAAGWLSTTYGTYTVEPHYRRIQPRVYCEALLEDEAVLLDYKVFCMNGTAKYIQVCGNREQMEDRKTSSVGMKLYDRDWNPVDAICGWGKHYPYPGEFEMPSKLQEMLVYAEILSKDFDFVRVDFYQVQDQVYFGEMTFTPALGILPAFKKSFLEQEGEQLQITTPHVQVRSN